MKRLLQLSLVLFIVTGLTTVANAQNNIASQATVSASLSVSGQNPLDFGTLAPGNPSSVAVSDGTAGRFLVAGNGGTVDLNFDLSNATLTGPGADIPVTFGAGTAAWGETNSSPTNTFDPSSTASTNVNLYDSSGEIYVFIGGSISVPTGQAAGDYTGEITLTASYN